MSEEAPGTGPGGPGHDHAEDPLSGDASSSPERTAASDGGSDGGEAPAENDFASGLADDPRTTELPRILDEREREAAEETVYELRSAAQRLEEQLLGGKRVLNRKEVAGIAGVSTVSARKFWRTLGLARVPPDEVAYTVRDAEALAALSGVVDSDVLDEPTALSLIRAIGQTTDRLVVWQMETLVEYLTDTKGMSDAEARRAALDLFDAIVDPLEDVLVYSWKRNLAGALGRLNVNVADGLAMANRQGWYDSSMPLARAIGFADLVSYTRLSQQMEPKQLAFMVKRFQDLVYNIVATGGGRVIKTVGDEVFFAAETPHAGAEIALTVQEAIIDDVLLPRARVGFAWGKVLSRLGDIFGSTVNLASRLTAVADPGTVVTDWDTAQIIQRTDDYRFSSSATLTLQGLGEVTVLRMERGTAEPLPLDIEEGPGD